MRHLFQIHPADNVAVALHDLAAGEADGIVLPGAISAGHKVALAGISKGSPVLKYGQEIGRATRDIAAGEHVHSHNVAGSLAESVGAESISLGTKDHGPKISATFDGYLRSDGRAATRNEIWIIPTVGCVNQASQQIAAAARDLPANVDGVHAFPHPFGCSQLGDDLGHTQKILAGLINHPNAGGVLVLGLGCENNQLRSLLDRTGPVEAERVKFFNAQDVADEIGEGSEIVGQLVEYASRFRRQAMPISSLTVAMKCGGSDGFSGITANPIVGRIADRLAAGGATVILSEVPEMFGAEHILLSRAGSKAVSDATVKMVNDFRDYFRRHHQPIDENPSPGNKDGGITTLTEKSLGCVQKGGHASITQVLAYGQVAAAASAGLALVQAPGNDAVSSTAMTAAGAQMLLFTTGRGTPMGFPVPTVKISSNSDLARRKPQWIDWDAGRLLDDAGSAEALTDELWKLVLGIASGRALARNEANNNREISIWKDGVTL